MDETITIVKTKFINILIDSLKYRSLVQEGVDNWPGYGEALDTVASSYYFDDKNKTIDERFLDIANFEIDLI